MIIFIVAADGLGLAFLSSPWQRWLLFIIIRAAFFHSFCSLETSDSADQHRVALEVGSGKLLKHIFSLDACRRRVCEQPDIPHYIRDTSLSVRRPELHVDHLPVDVVH